MPRVVLSEEEIFKFHTESPSIPIEYCTGLLQRKGSKFKTTFGTYTEEHNLPELTPLEKKVLEELGKLGYTHHYMFYGDSYVPRGLADDDGNGTSYKNYGIMVKW